MDENRGLGEALAFGISKCKNELIARMDADDISLSDRCEKQLIEFRKKNVDVVGGLIVEFYDKPSNLKNVRVVPEHLDEIIKFSKFRSPVNHVSVMYKRSSVLAAGGYKDFPFLEDYYLWIRMLANGAIFYNMQQPLVLVRTGKSMYVRRSGFKLCRSQVRLAKYMKSIGYVSYGDFLKNVIVRVGGTLLPSLIRRSIYEQKLRDKANPCNYQ